MMFTTILTNIVTIITVASVIDAAAITDCQVDRVKELNYGYSF